jgi:hypothetical protein
MWPEQNLALAALLLSPEDEHQTTATKANDMQIPSSQVRDQALKTLSQQQPPEVDQIYHD